MGPAGPACLTLEGLVQPSKVVCLLRLDSEVDIAVKFFCEEFFGFRLRGEGAGGTSAEITVFDFLDGSCSESTRFNVSIVEEVGGVVGRVWDTGFSTGRVCERWMGPRARLFVVSETMSSVTLSGNLASS